MVCRTRTSLIESQQKAYPLNKAQTLLHNGGILSEIADRVLFKFGTEERSI